MKWLDFYNNYEGQTCLVIGNGPSLKDIPISFLKKYPSFGTNRIYLLEGFTPTYYCCVNPLVIEQSLEQIRAIDCKAKFLLEDYVSSVPLSLGLTSTPFETFSMNPRAYIYEGYTITFVCLQLAYYFGFNTVLLVGVDHSFAYEGNPNQQVMSHGPDMNHFHPDYFGNGIEWNNPDLEKSEQAYMLAKKVFEDDGKKIINLTAKTKLEIFKKGNVNDF